MDGSVERWIDELINKWVGEWMNELINRWVEERIFLK